MTVASDSRSPMKSCGAIMSFTVSIASPDLILSSARTHPLNHHSIPINYHHPHHWTSRFIVARNKTWHTNRVLKKFISQSQMSWATKTVFYRISCCVGVIYYFFSAFHSFIRFARENYFAYFIRLRRNCHIKVAHLFSSACNTLHWRLAGEQWESKKQKSSISWCLWSFSCAQKNNKFLIISRHCLSPCCAVFPFFLLTTKIIWA